MDKLQIKPVVWVGSSYRDLKDFPSEVQRDIGYALWLAQMGRKYDKSKPLKGFRGVMEIVSDFRTDTYRAIYTARLGPKLYVLHAFQKKSKRGITTPKKEIDTIRKRLQEARGLAQEDK